MATSRRSGVVLASIGIGSQAGSQLVAAMLLARMLDAAQFGRFALTLGIAAPLVLAVGMQLHVIAATNVDARVDDFALVRLRLRTFAALVGGAAVTLAFSPDTSGIMWLLGAQVLWRAIDLIGEFVGGLRQREGRFLSSAASQALRAALAYGAMVVAVAFKLPLGLALLVGATCAGAVVILADAKVLRGLLFVGRSREPVELRRIPVFWGMGVAAMLDSFVFNLPRYVVELTGGPEQVARFSVGLYPVMLGGVLASSVAVAVRPVLAKQFNADVVAAVRSSWRLVGAASAVGVMLMLIGAFVGSQALEMLFGSSYGGLRTVLIVLFLAATLWYVAGFANSAVVASGRLRGQAQMFALSAGAALGCSLVAARAGMGPELAGAAGVLGGMLIRATLSVGLLRSVPSEGQ